ncbi:alpha/beta hydrolase [Actinokineospora auranticolor]|nr:alpha/beta hydrolase [Actinokineospora auranticolor]
MARAAVVATALATAAVTAPVAASAASAASPPAATAATAAPVVWKDCPADALPGVPPADHSRYGCADYAVPLDYDNPRRGTINIALMRRVASGAAGSRIGSLFVNPGGPGGPGFGMPTAADRFLRPEVLDRFDVVGFDPRGIGRSTPLRCFATAEDAAAVRGKIHEIPRTAGDIAATIEGDREYARFCDRFARPLLPEMSTKAVARDLDLLRAAVGDQRLTYVGFSYGTLLGATYSALFPDRTRAIVLDGSVDPALRTTNGVEYDRQRTEGFEVALDAFLKECDRVGPACAYSGGARAKYDADREYVKAHGPVTLSDGTVVTHELFVTAIGRALYQRDALKHLAELLQELHTIIHNGQSAARAAPRSALTRSPLRDTHPDTPYTGDDSYAAVNCLDKPFTTPLNKVPALADRWDKTMPTFGRYGAWGDTATCAEWPVPHPDRFAGPWNRPTKTPVLVVGNFYDPATRYTFAQNMAKELGNATLLSTDNFGHCVLGDNSCADRAAADYLITLKTPVPGQVCAPDRGIFDPA